MPIQIIWIFRVSTHSRLKAAGPANSDTGTADGGFNTQPPEGGWGSMEQVLSLIRLVSTHSRLKAAGLDVTDDGLSVILFQHTAA